ncbi:MAG: phosphopantetheine-binding protein [Pirellulaceae bacterium]
MAVRDEIVAVIRQVADESGKELADDFGDETVLLQSGLDSLDFAIVVVRLEETLDADPFSVMKEPIYPRTLADFVAIYEGFFAEHK